MNNRREFIAKYGAGIAGIIAAGKAPAAIVKSMLGIGVKYSAKADGWENPYITDGLIAMYDGIWNAGPFLHDAKIMPVELTRKGFLNLSFEGNIEMTDNSVLFHSQSYAIDRTLQNLSKYDAITIEYIMTMGTKERNGGNIGSFGWIHSGTGYSSSRRICGLYHGGNGNCNVFHMGAYDDTGYYAIYAGKASYTVVADLTDGTAPAKFYRNGELRTLTVQRTTTNKNKNPTAAFALRRLNNTTSTNENETFALRVYGRELTATEIAYNYAIDKERFGL